MLIEKAKKNFKKLFGTEAKPHLMVLVCIGADMQLKPHIAGAIKAGNTLEEITAAIVQVLPYIGFPPALSALVKVLQRQALIIQ